MIVLGLVVAACWSSYLELASQAVAGSKIRLSWAEFRRTLGARFWDVVSVMFAFWIISLLLGPALRGPDGERVSAVFGLAVAFFFNAVPELLYQGHSRTDTASGRRDVSASVTTGTENCANCVNSALTSRKEVITVSKLPQAASQRVGTSFTRGRWRRYCSLHGISSPASMGWGRGSIGNLDPPGTVAATEGKVPEKGRLGEAQCWVEGLLRRVGGCS